MNVGDSDIQSCVHHLESYSARNHDMSGDATKEGSEEDGEDESG
jgi:hypothetical protein